MQDVGADDQVEAPLESESPEITETTEAKVAELAVATHDVLAGIDANIADARPCVPKHGAPTSLSATDVQNVPDLSLEQILGG